MSHLHRLITMILKTLLQIQTVIGLAVAGQVLLQTLEQEPQVNTDGHLTADQHQPIIPDLHQLTTDQYMSILKQLILILVI